MIVLSALGDFIIKLAVEVTIAVYETKHKLSQEAHVAGGDPTSVRDAILQAHTRSGRAKEEASEDEGVRSDDGSGESSVH